MAKPEKLLLINKLNELTTQLSKLLREVLGLGLNVGFRWIWKFPNYACFQCKENIGGGHEIHHSPIRDLGFILTKIKTNT